MFNFSSIKPTAIAKEKTKYIYREEVKKLVVCLFKNGFYDPNNADIVKKTDEEIFDILEKDLDKEISWTNIGCLYNKSRGSLHISLFDSRMYYVISSVWSIEEKDVNAVTAYVKDERYGPVFWRMDSSNSFRLQLPVCYPFNEEILINSLKYFDSMESSLVDDIKKII